MAGLFNAGFIVLIVLFGRLRFCIRERFVQRVDRRFDLCELGRVDRLAGIDALFQGVDLSLQRRGGSADRKQGGFSLFAEGGIGQGESK